MAQHFDLVRYGSTDDAELAGSCGSSPTGQSGLVAPAGFGDCLSGDTETAVMDAMASIFPCLT